MLPRLLHSPFTNSKYRVFEEEIFYLISVATTFNQITQTHAQIFTLGLHQNNFIATKLINFCSSINSIAHACLTFHHVSNPTISLWNSFIRALSQNNLPFETLKTYTLMKTTQIPPDNFTFPFVLKSCASLPPSPPLGRAIHGEVIRSGLDLDPYIQNSLIGMYSKTECLSSALFVFEQMTVRDVVTWNSMIAGCFRRENVEKGRDIFDRMLERNVVSWNTVIAGYSQNGKAIEALRLFRTMQAEGISPYDVTLVSVLSACAQAGAIEIGKWVHHYIQRIGIKMDIHLNNCLIDMYSKGGSLCDARKVFDGMSERTAVSWNSMISGLAMHGFGEEAFLLFQEIGRVGVEPSDITYIGVLCACRHAAMVDEGQKYFKMMVEDGIVPKVEHYGCMVDLLGREGCVTEAYKLIKSMPVPPDAGVWGALLGACRAHGHVVLAERAICIFSSWSPGMPETTFSCRIFMQQKAVGMVWRE